MLHLKLAVLDAVTISALLAAAAPVNAAKMVEFLVSVVSTASVGSVITLC